VIDLRRRRDVLEHGAGDQDERSAAVLGTIRQLMNQMPSRPKPPIGYRTEINPTK